MSARSPPTSPGGGSRSSPRLPPPRDPPAYHQELTEKRKAKAEAINAHDYKQSARIQKEIDALLGSNRNLVLDDHKEALKHRILTDLGNYDSNLIEIENDFIDEEQNLRLQISSLFDAVQARHRFQITAVEARCIRSTRTAKLRTTSEFVAADAASRRLAADDLPEEATAIWEEAQVLRDRQRQAEVDAIEAKRIRRLEALMVRHAAELAQLDADLESALAAAEQNKLDAIEAQTKAAKVAVKAALQGAIVEANKKVTTKALRAGILPQLTAFVQELLKQEDKSYLL
jgi:hypothetical protein